MKIHKNGQSAANKLMKIKQDFLKKLVLEYKQIILKDRMYSSIKFLFNHKIVHKMIYLQLLIKTEV